jgi:hypothetical protein
MSTPVSRRQEKNALKAVLASGIFARALRQAKLPAYICNEYFKHKSEQTKLSIFLPQRFTFGIILGRSEMPVNAQFAPSDGQFAPQLETGRQAYLMPWGIEAWPDMRT